MKGHELNVPTAARPAPPASHHVPVLKAVVLLDVLSSLHHRTREVLQVLVDSLEREPANLCTNVRWFESEHKDLDKACAVKMFLLAGLGQSNMKSKNPKCRSWICR